MNDPHSGATTTADPHNTVSFTGTPRPDPSDPLQIKMEISLSPEGYGMVRGLMKATGWPLAEVIRNALGLLKVAADAKEQGMRLAILDQDDAIDREIIGL